jgi:hypothetical protein
MEDKVSETKSRHKDGGHQLMFESVLEKVQ